MTTKAEKKQQMDLPDLANVEVKPVSQGEMKKVKEKTFKPIHPIAQRMATELFKNPDCGARIELNAALQPSRDQIKRVLANGLKQAAKREHKNLKVRCVAKPNELVFYYEPAKPKEKNA